MKQTAGPVLLVVLFAALMVRLPIAIAERTSAYEWFDPIIDVRRILLDQSIHRPEEEAMQQAMIQAMIRTLDDPHTIYIPPSAEAEFNKDLRGTYVGIGAEVTIVDDYLTIVTPMDGSPALEAGVAAGDVVLEIEGVSTYQVPITESIDRLVGEPGTEVSIRVRHLDGSEEDLTVTRRQIITPTVKGLRRMGEAWNFCVDADLDLAYLRVTQFNNSTVHDLKAVLDQLREAGLGGLILDLRDNHGGSLGAAVAMADLFIEEGKLVSVTGRDESEQRSMQASQRDTLPHFPMVVLVNGTSASASEIVAGALQDHERAKVLGTRTYGKGSVQEVRQLPYDRGTLKFTSAHYYLPNGRSIDRKTGSAVWGVDPDPGMVVAISDEAYLEMIRARRDHEVIREEADGLPACAEVEWIRTNLKDEQLAQAVEALAASVSSGAWPKLSDDDSAQVAFNQALHRAAERRAELLDQILRIEQRIEELQAAAGEIGKEPLLPPEMDLRQGTLVINDKQGQVVGTYRIEGGDLELALATLELTKLSGP
ncbi:MAG: S41 family peptidase [Planctomycetota bacterium]|jgi:carboxyl-terminal processing protease